MTELIDLISDNIIAIITFILGALLTAYIKLPAAILEKKISWKHEKKVQITAEFYENVAKINFLIGEYFKEYCDSAQSFSAMNLKDTDESVFKIFSEIYGSRYKAKLYMDENDYSRFDDLSPKNRTMTSMRFPLKWVKWRSRYEKTLQRRANHQGHQRA
ncbi:MAG: hypothetical protein HLX52_13945 [Idiomarinaceae bacterium]|uniref:hypothetical protein n=1 Tax=Idiomarina sp. 28-8 TaxID=1260624 RepID=UPI00054EEF71|nr:hypothetical protein [Idiomarina sp. 28-8]NWO04028.1 hypothetical protein [Idiomarinaceae bacterium]